MSQTREDRMRFIAELRKENEESVSLAFSRECSLCTMVPRTRAVFSACGHVFCHACTYKMQDDADEANLTSCGPIACPNCRKEGGFKMLEEELIEQSSCGTSPTEDSSTAKEAELDAIDAERTRLKAERAHLMAERAAIRQDSPNSLTATAAALKEATEAVEPAGEESERCWLVYEDSLDALNAAIDVFDAATDAHSRAIASGAAEEISGCVAAVAEAQVAKVAARAATKAAGEILIAAREAMLHATIIVAIASEADLAAINTSREYTRNMQELRISLMRLDDKEGSLLGLRFSRLCRACNTNSPRRRAFFVNCGHAICRACAEQRAADVADADTELDCPVCQTGGSFVPLYEDEIEEGIAEN